MIVMLPDQVPPASLCYVAGWDSLCSKALEMVLLASDNQWAHLTERLH